MSPTEEAAIADQPAINTKLDPFYDTDNSTRTKTQSHATLITQCHDTLISHSITPQIAGLSHRKRAPSHDGVVVPDGSLPSPTRPHTDSRLQSPPIRPLHTTPPLPDRQSPCHAPPGGSRPGSSPGWPERRSEGWPPPCICSGPCGRGQRTAVSKRGHTQHRASFCQHIWLDRDTQREKTNQLWN